MYFCRWWTPCAPYVTVQLRSGQRQAWAAQSRIQTVRTRPLNLSRTWTRPLGPLHLLQAHWVRADCPASIHQPLPPSMAPKTGAHSFIFLFVWHRLVFCRNLWNLVQPYKIIIYMQFNHSIQHRYWISGTLNKMSPHCHFIIALQLWELGSNDTYH